MPTWREQHGGKVVDGKAMPGCPWMIGRLEGTDNPGTSDSGNGLKHLPDTLSTGFAQRPGSYNVAAWIELNWIRPRNQHKRTLLRYYYG
jgi:hypothetical protein